MTTINKLPQPILPEIFAKIPDVRLRLVCKIWKQTFDGMNFKMIMGRLYDRWIRTTVFWQAIQLKWKSIFGLPLQIDIDLGRNLTWAQRIEKIAKFLYLQNPAMVAFCRANLSRNNKTPLLNEIDKRIWNTDDKKEASIQARLLMKEACVSAVFSAKEEALIKMLPQPKVKDMRIQGNLSLEKLELLSQEQMVELKRIEWYANSRLG